MIGKIIGTIGSRVINAVGMILLMLLISKILHSDGLGLWQLSVLNVAVFLLVSELFTGSVISYFSSRKKISHLLIIALSWLIITTLIFVAFIYFLQYFPHIEKYIIPSTYVSHVLILSVAMAILQIIYNLLIGKERIKEYNMVFMLHIILVVSFISLFFYGFHLKSINAFYYAEYLSIFISGMLGIYYVSPDIKFEGGLKFKSLVIEMFQYSSFGQTSNLITLINKRLSYFYLKGMLGLSSLGIYAGGMQLTEGLKVLGSSIATVQYARIANSRNMEQSKKITLQLLKLTAVITCLGLLFLLLIPSSWYVALFGHHFSAVKSIILYLSPGVLALMMSMILSHFFSGMGLIKYNMWAAITGMIFTFSLLFILIRLYGNIGAAMTVSIAHIATFMYHLIVFIRKTKPKISEFLLKKEDFSIFISGIKDFFISLR